MAKSKNTSKPSTGKKAPKVTLSEEPISVTELDPKDIIIIPPENYIDVCIETIANIKSKLLSQQSGVKFRIQFGDDFISESPVFPFPEYDDREITVKWLVSIPCSPTITENLEFLCANPVLVSVAEEEIKVIVDEDQSYGSAIELPVEPPKEVEFNAFAYCSLDLLPLILGEPEFSQTLLLEVSRKGKGGNASGNEKKGKAGKKEKASKGSSSSKGKSSDKESKGKSSKASASSKDEGSRKGDKKGKKGKEKSESLKEDALVTSVTSDPPASVALLPLISVCASVQTPLVNREIVNESNLIFLTVESIYNLPQNFDGESMEFQAGSLIPNEFDREQEIRFGEGFWKNESDRERIKRWINIDHFPGKSSHTQYKMSDNLFPVKNKLGVDLCQVMNTDAPRIEWNKMRRSWLSSSGAEYLGDYILKRKTWLLEILVTSKASKKKPNAKAKPEPTVNENMHLAAFFDVSKLMHPGIDSVRDVSQLFTYCKDDVEAKCGAKSRSVLSLPVESVRPASKGKTKLGKKDSKSKKKGSKSGGETGTKESKSGSKSSKKLDASVKSFEAPEVPPEVIVPCEPKPWVTEDGKPVFVLLELKLMKPLKARKSKEELFAEIDDLITVKPKIPEHEMAAKKAGEDHAHCIRHLTRKLTQEYHKFVLQRKKLNFPINVGDQNTKDFYQFLKETGMIPYIKSQLSNSLAVLIKNKLGYDVASREEQDSKLKHKFVTDLYIRLFEEVNSIVNTLHDTTAEGAATFQISSEQLRWFEQEAYILGFPNKQKAFYQERIQRDEDDVLTRIEFSSQCNNLEEALHNTFEILMVQKDCKEGLLLYAVLLAKKGDIKKAELFFQAVCEKYPRFLCAGFFFYLFYVMIGNQTGAEVVWETARKNTAFSVERSLCDQGFHHDCIDWDPQAYQITSLYLEHVITLMRIRVLALEFAYLALAEEHKRNGPSVPYYYFLSVCHYRSGRYEDACTVLESLLVETPRENHVRRLLAHCQFSMGKMESAIENYQFVVETSDDGVANHLVHLRLGDFYLKCKDYESAKTIYFESCKCSPTSNSWLGVGIACYMLKDYGESEQALMEANYLDRTLPIVWGYLTLVNLQLFREMPFEQCYCRAVRYHLEDEKVLKMIDELIYARGFATPKLIHSESMHTSCPP